MRTSRTNGSTTYSYVYNGGSLSQMTVGSNTLYFAYDASGTPMSVTYNGTNYYYATNIHGDVTAILNTSGTAVVQYTYDAWGKLLTTTGSMASTLGTHNPLRYRGYVYDTEIGLYYVSSRYYDPEIGRFINADVLVSTGQGILGNNMFAYCLNNPVNCADSIGCMAYYCADDPAVELGKMIGEWLSELIEEETEEDKKKIEDGTVSYSSKGAGNGATINNSHEIDTPWVMYEYVNRNRGDDITGTTTGVVFEWACHNIAYDVGRLLKIEQITLKAEHVDVGATIYSDRREGFWENIMSLEMKAFYTLFFPITGAYDLVKEIGS